ncbi:MAG: exodeoxyribonuclease VII small subunit [Lentisphaeria bacterium]|nr:exodeoxyribonuclease VII small subunit [Lentisphaeria bacterium]
MEIPEDIRALTFEQSRAQLEELVARMESGSMPLEELIGAYERGSLLAAHCRNLLAGLQRRVEIIINGNDPQAKEAQCREFAPEANQGDRRTADPF